MDFMMTLPMFFGISLMFAGMAGKHQTFRALADSLVPYFFSFSPVALLIYLLYEISHLY